MTFQVFRARLKLLLSILLVLVPTLCYGQDTTGIASFRGTILDEASRSALAGATICLQADIPRCATTDSNGQFRIGDLRAGKYQVEICRPEQQPSQKVAVEIHAGVENTFELSVARLDVVRQQIEVTDSVVTTPEEVKTSGYMISAQVIRDSASALKDVSRYVQTLPGVTFGGNDFRNDIVVRGGSPLENLYIVDNVEIPNINHFANFASAGGPVGMINGELIDNVTFLSGGYSAPYSNRLSSVLQVTQREGSRDRAHGQATLGFAGAGLIGEGPLSQKGSWVVSVRRSFLDLFTKDIGLGGVPIYSNVEGKAVYDLGPKNRIWLVDLGGRDNIKIRPNGTKDTEASDPNNIDYRGWRNASGLNWQQIIGNRGVGLLGLTYSTATLSADARDIQLGDTLVARNRSTEDDLALKYDLTLNVPLLQRLQVGGSGHWLRVDYDQRRPIGIENPYSPAPGRVNAFSVLEYFWTRQSNAYLQITRNLGSRLSLTAGGRVDRYTFLNATRYSPRVGITYRICPQVSANASYGTYYQQPFFSFTEANPVNRALLPMRADHYVAGLSYTPSSSIRATVEVYEKRYSKYPVALQYPQISLASAGDDYGPSYYLFPMTSAGKGHARGIEFFIEKKLTSRLYGQVNFSVSRTLVAALDGVFRPGAFDSPRIFNATGGYRLTKNWEVAGRYVFLSGRPYTPFDQTLSQQQDRAIYDLSQVNVLRALSYQRLDFRFDRTLRLWEGSMDLYFGLQNAFNRKNFQAYTWNFRTNQQKFEHQLGIYPIGGFEWRF
jgi:hypothetical protein